MNGGAEAQNPVDVVLGGFDDFHESLAEPVVSVSGVAYLHCSEQRPDYDQASLRLR